MDIMRFINEGIFSPVEGAIILLFFMYLSNNNGFIKSYPAKACIFLVFYTIFSYWASAYLPMGFHSICIVVFLIIVLAFITKSNLYASSIIVAILYTLMLIVESCVIVTEMLVLKVDINTIINVPQIKLYTSICVKLVEIGLIILLHKSDFQLFKSDIFKEKSYTQTFVILQGFMMGVFIVSINCVVSQNTNIIFYYALLFSIYILFIALAYLDFKERERILKVEQKFKVQEEYVQNLESMINVIRREKHDFANHLNTIQAICLLKKPNALQKIQEYIHKLTRNIKSSYQFFNTGNDYVDGLLAVKSNFAFENDIYLEVDIEEPLNRLKINDSDLTSIIGNIVDNAFEAIMTQPEREGKVLSISTYIEDNYYYLSIADNGPEIPNEYKKKLFESGFTTKANCMKENGFGLYIVKKYVDSNGGEIMVSSSENETEFLIKFKLEGVETGHEESSNVAYKRNTEGQSQPYGFTN